MEFLFGLLVLCGFGLFMEITGDDDDHRHDDDDYDPIS